MYDKFFKEFLVARKFINTHDINLLIGNFFQVKCLPFVNELNISHVYFLLFHLLIINN